MLPYTDTKPVGAADFYFAINATFRFIRQTLGDAALIRYWTDLGGSYFQPVTRLWQKEGLAAVAEYWRDFFKAEPNAKVEVQQTPDAVVVRVMDCPAIRHLRQSGREIELHFCRHCYHVSEAMAAPAGLTVRVKGGNGCCRQTFLRAGAPPQQFTAIEDCP